MSHKQVHPRSIYRTPPSFKDMAIKYPKFRQFVVQELSGRVTIDFKDPAALRALSTTLLDKDFGLDVELPLDRLVPAVPSRINYILWLEDVLQAVGSRAEGDTGGLVHGIDIGTGASCIYSLLAAKTKGWNMLATEVDPENYKCASENVRRNNLEHLIQVKPVEAGVMLKGVLSEGQQYDFCMCNPPFFSNEEELGGEGKSRSPARPPPRSHFTGSPSDVMVSGGEVAFVSTIIQESKELGTTVRIYSSLLGHKSSLGLVKAKLGEAGATSVVDTTYCQGRTARWYVAWTFVAGCNLRRKVAAPPRHNHPGKKDKPPLKWVVPRPSDAGHHPLAVVSIKVKELLQVLQMSVRGLRSNEKMQSFQVTAFENTWSNQRKKRRAATHSDAPSNCDAVACQQSSEQPTLESGASPSCSEAKAQEADANLPCVSPREAAEERAVVGDKRKLTEVVEMSKKLKTDTTGCLLRAGVAVTKSEDDIVLEMTLVEGTGGREVLHQVMQYFKNNLKL